MSIPQKQKDRERRKKLKHRKPTMSEMPIPTTKVFKDKRRKSRQQEKINLKKVLIFPPCINLIYK